MSVVEGSNFTCSLAQGPKQGSGLQKNSGRMLPTLLEAHCKVYELGIAPRNGLIIGWSSWGVGC